jgi:hypothetical protein
LGTCFEKQLGHTRMIATGIAVLRAVAAPAEWRELVARISHLQERASALMRQQRSHNFHGALPRCAVERGTRVMAGRSWIEAQVEHQSDRPRVAVPRCVADRPVIVRRH